MQMPSRPEEQHGLVDHADSCRRRGLSQASPFALHPLSNVSPSGQRKTIVFRERPLKQRVRHRLDAVFLQKPQKRVHRAVAGV